jgi:hypothetical protein
LASPETDRLETAAPRSWADAIEDHRRALDAACHVESAPEVSHRPRQRPLANTCRPSRNSFPHELQGLLPEPSAQGSCCASAGSRRRDRPPKIASTSPQNPFHFQAGAHPGRTFPTRSCQTSQS